MNKQTNMMEEKTGIVHVYYFSIILYSLGIIILGIVVYNIVAVHTFIVITTS